jgi:parvulin-like peptidyl-prolyl isomerase
MSSCTLRGILHRPLAGLRRQLLLVSLAVGSAALALPLPARAGTVIDRIVAVVNDDIILESDVNQAAVMNMRAELGEVDVDSPEGQRKFEALRRKTLDSLVEKQLIAQQAKELKIYVAEEEMRRALEDVKKSNNLTDFQFAEALKQQGFSLDSYRKQLRQQLLELKVINQTVRSRISIGDDEVRAYYAQTVRQATGDQLQVHLLQILIPVAKNASPQVVEEKRRLAGKLVEQLRGGGDFATLAKQYNDDKSGGDIGWVARGDLPEEMRDTVASMDAGDLRGPVKSDRGFHIIQLLEKKDAEVRSFDEVKESLRRQLYDQQVEKGVLSWTKELRRKGHIDIRL